jgi:hypothetical protein
MNRRYVVLVSLLLIVASAAYTAARRTDSFGYPYEFANRCDQTPILSASEITRIAEFAHFPKLPDGYWIIDFLKGGRGNDNPFPDHCIWMVLDGAPAGAMTVGSLNMYVEDSTRKFWLPGDHYDSRTRSWYLPAPADVAAAPPP